MDALKQINASSFWANTVSFKHKWKVVHFTLMKMNQFRIHGSVSVMLDVLIVCLTPMFT